MTDIKKFEKIVKDLETAGITHEIEHIHNSTIFKLRKGNNVISLKPSSIILRNLESLQDFILSEFERTEKEQKKEKVKITEIEKYKDDDIMVTLYKVNEEKPYRVEIAKKLDHIALFYYESLYDAVLDYERFLNSKGVRK